jgi:hypothetical protein
MEGLVEFTVLRIPDEKWGEMVASTMSPIRRSI